MSGIFIINSTARILSRSLQIKCLTSFTSSKKFYHNEIKDDAVLAPYRHLYRNSGTVSITKMYSVFNYWLNIPENKIKQIDDFMASIYVAFFMIDDLYDDSPIRSKTITAHRIYGVPMVITTALYITFDAYKKCKNIHADACDLYVDAHLKLCKGEAIEIKWRDLLVCPTEEEYRTLVMHKTAPMYLLGLQLMQLFSANKSDFTNLILKIALYIQIHDDYLDCKAVEEDESYCLDLLDGKCSYPIIHAINNHPEDISIKYILRSRSKNKDVHEHFTKLLERYGSYDYTKQKLRELLDEIKVEMKNFESNPKMERYLLHLHYEKDYGI